MKNKQPKTSLYSLPNPKHRLPDLRILIRLISSFILAITATFSFGQSLSVITELDELIDESSGLLILDGRFITHNDSGGEAALYEIDTLSGEVIRTVVLENATNVDWEDMCMDDDYIYIADFGNNSGSRTNLKIYRIPIDVYLTTETNIVASEAIQFTYSDQTDFSPTTFSTNFDAEALVCIGDSLHIFTKNWGNFRSNHYTLPKVPGSYTAQRRDSILTDGLITGAAYLASQQKLILSGYSFFLAPFYIEIPEYNGSIINTDLMQILSLEVPAGYSTQIEGIHFDEENHSYFTSETSFTGASALMKLGQKHTLDVEQAFGELALIYPNPASNIVHVAMNKDESAAIYDMSGKLLITSTQPNIGIDILKSGAYLIVVHDNQGKPLQRHRLLVSE